MRRWFCEAMTITIVGHCTRSSPAIGANVANSAIPIRVSAGLVTYNCTETGGVLYENSQSGRLDFPDGRSQNLPKYLLAFCPFQHQSSFDFSHNNPCRHTPGPPITAPADVTRQLCEQATPASPAGRLAPDKLHPVSTACSESEPSARFHPFDFPFGS